MRLQSIILDGFRAFGTREEFDLGADATIVVGANGQGKTSLFDGILWALTGTIPRFSADGSVLSMWSQSGQARVELALVGTEGRLGVIRTYDGEDTTLAVKRDDRLLRSDEAELEMMRLLWADGLAAADPRKALCSALEHGTYLQQDLVTQFIAADSPKERFAAISELIGSGRIRELQETLEKARRAWSSATNTRTRERDEVAHRVANLENRLAQLQEPASAASEFEKEWTHWWEQYRDLVDDPGPNPALTPDATGPLDVAIRHLRGESASWERRRQEIESAAELVGAVPPAPTDDLDDLRKRAEIAESDLATAQATLESAREQAAALRRQHIELQERGRSLATFASLALNHLGEQCPVCGQDYDREHTEAHLRLLMDQAGVGAIEPPTLDVSEQAAAVEAAERRLADARAAVEGAEHRRSTWQAQGVRARAALAALGVTDSPDVQRRLLELADEDQKRVQRAEGLHAEGESFALRLARIVEAARRQEIQEELEEQQQVLGEYDVELGARKQTGDVASSIIEGLREASASVVSARLDEMQPLIQRFFATADPHPAFRNAGLESEFKGGAGRVTPHLSDPATAKTTDLPHEYLSSSQVNVLAVAVFLAINLSMPSLPVRAAILDDPLQSLDDLNLLGVVDLFRRLRQHRQLLVSTHDERFAQLMRRKLRPVDENQRTRMIVFESWRREGPIVRQFDLDRERMPLRLAS